MNITVSEILEALSKAQPEAQDNPPNTFTGPEIRTALSVTKEKFPLLMRPLIDSGAVTVVKVRRVAIDGRIQAIPSYHFVV